MNLRFPEVFGLLLVAALLCSFALPRSLSGRIENTFQFIFEPVAGPIQWMTGGKNAALPADVPILSGIGEEVPRLREEKAQLQAYVETLRGQIETLTRRESQQSQVGEELRNLVTLVKVAGIDAAGHDILRLSGVGGVSIEKGQPVVTNTALVGRIDQVGLGNTSNVQLITDRGFKLIGSFGRYQGTGDGRIELIDLKLDPALLEGAGNGQMRVDSLRLADVKIAGLKVGDIVRLGDIEPPAWPIEVHGRRVGTVTRIGQKLDAPGVAEIWVQPETNLLKLREVWVLTAK